MSETCELCFVGCPVLKYWQDRGVRAHLVVFWPEDSPIPKRQVIPCGRDDRAKMIAIFREEARKRDERILPHCVCCHRNVPARQIADAADGDGLCLDCRMEEADAEARLPSDQRAGCPDEDPAPRYNSQGDCVVCYGEHA